MRIIFFGTPEFAVPTLERLATSSHTVAGVVTQPDRARGRGQKVLPSAVKAAALARGLSISQPERLKDPAWLESIRAWQADLAVVAAYGRLLPQSILDLPSRGVINVHASLLPRWRGAAPIHRAVLAGDPATGVTIMRVVLALDAGPMLDAVTTPIEPHETSHDLERRLSTMGADLLMRVVDRMAEGSVSETPQDDTLTTHAPRLERRESRIDWTRSAGDLHNQIRGLQPWPLAGALWHDRRLMFLQSTVEPAESGPAGRIISVDRTSFVVGTGSTGLRVLTLREAGRPTMSTRDFLNGRRVQAGDVLEPLPID